VLLSNGNLLIAHQFAVKLISPERKVLWNVDAPKGTEIHTAMPIGTGHVLYVQNGDPALVKVVNIKTGETKKEFQVPVGNPKGVHGQFRHGRITSRGTLLLAHMDMKKVCEYDANGKEVRSFAAPNPWGVTPLKNGNILIVDRPSIREVTLAGETVATITPSVDSPDFKMNSLQMAWRLPNGNTLICAGAPGITFEVDPSGRVVWQFNTVPDSGPALATWPKASPKNPPSGGATWTSYALDEANGILYVPTGNPAPDFAHALRPGENLYTNALLALDAKTGRLLAYVQPLQGDFHDWDLAAAPALITTKGGRPFVAAGSKDGHVYNIDRGAVTTQTSDPPSADHLVVRSKALVTTSEHADTPLSTEHETRFCPGVQGGVEWNGPSYHPDLGLLFVNAIDWCTSVKMQPMAKITGAPGDAWTGAEPADGWLFGRHDPVEQARGWVTAFDAESGEIKWKVQTPRPMVAAITATAGGLVLTGDLDGNLIAYDASTGKELWRNAIGKAIGGGVISYDVGGTQYIAAATGLNAGTWQVKAGPARVVVYALP